MFKNGKILSLGEIDLTFHQAHLDALTGCFFFHK